MPRRSKPKELIAISPLGQPPNRTTSKNGATNRLISPKISMDRTGPMAATFPEPKTPRGETGRMTASQRFKLLFFV